MQYLVIFEGFTQVSFWLCQVSMAEPRNSTS